MILQARGLTRHTSPWLQTLPAEKRFMEAIIHKRFSAGIMNTAIYTATSADGKGSEVDPSHTVNAVYSKAAFTPNSSLPVLHNRFESWWTLFV